MIWVRPPMAASWFRYPEAATVRVGYSSRLSAVIMHEVDEVKERL